MFLEPRSDRDQLATRFPVASLAPQFPEFELSPPGHYVDYGGSVQNRIVVHGPWKVILADPLLVGKLEALFVALMALAPPLTKEMLLVFGDQSGKSPVYPLLNLPITKPEEMQGLLASWAALIKGKKLRGEWFARRDGDWFTGNRRVSELLASE
jgi:hypothetical protein